MQLHSFYFCIANLLTCTRHLMNNIEQSQYVDAERAILVQCVARANDVTQSAVINETRNTFHKSLVKCRIAECGISMRNGNRVRVRG